MYFPNKLVYHSSSSSKTISNCDFVDIKHTLFDNEKHNPSFIGESVTDVTQSFMMLDSPNIFRFEIKDDYGFVGVEETLEASRFLCSESARFVPVCPLEPSMIFALQRMLPEAIEIHPCWPAIGEYLIQVDLLKYICTRVNLPIWIYGYGLTSATIKKALDSGCSTVIVTKEG
jgi:hypothetical protein